MPRTAHAAPRWSAARLRRAILGTLALLVTGCATAEPVVEDRPLDAGQVALAAERASALDAPYRIIFDWSFSEPGMRVEGRGVARLEPPYRARLDLFNGNGDRITSAALVDGELRLPEGAPSILPPPTLIWASLGIFRPESGLGLAGGSWRRDGAAELRYLPGGDSELLMRLEGSRLRDVVRRTGGRAVEDLTLQRAEGERFPRRATYRDLSNTRELVMTLESVEHVESYPGHVWDPGR